MEHGEQDTGDPVSPVGLVSPAANVKLNPSTEPIAAGAGTKR